MAKKNRTPNDQRSDVKNRTSKEYWQDKANREKQKGDQFSFGFFNFETIHGELYVKVPSQPIGMI